LNGGDKITHKIEAGEDPRMVASRLTPTIYRMLRGETRQAGTAFNRPLSYPGVPSYRRPSRTGVQSSSQRGIVKWQIRSNPKGDGFLSVTKSAPDADRYGDESDANP
jgi:hypothetical protein